MQRTLIKLTLVIAAALPLFTAGTATAATVVAVGSPDGNSFRIGGPNSQVETIAWTQAGSFTGVTVAATIGALDGSMHNVNAYLTSAIGAGAGAPIATANVTVASFTGEAAFTPVTLFSGLSLGAGSYYLTLFNSDTSGNVNTRWATGTMTTFGTGVSSAGEYFTNLNNGVPNTSSPWRSTFITSSLYSNLFSVTGAAVPESAQWALLLTGFAVIGTVARRRRAVGLGLVAA